MRELINIKYVTVDSFLSFFSFAQAPEGYLWGQMVNKVVIKTLERVLH